ncbi:DUF397 domain-containing protein [Haloechinothrix sp. YIM 98757]|uniref:DUF397 domain-containing protein n=1 Tax=Haloechinothrix aidingensis TaxID=2752311 RepID=A0A838AE60_9PSEU|nr:DUF397 domain-containing protein [Haloechinothrix aidingensis]MBA0127589.1 DUF397 domain-containing protein [Haloechinothrix aidingensis]
MNAPELSHATWRKSSYSDADHNCVEVAFPWHTSSYSDAHGNCVEVAVTERVTSVRDSKDPHGGVLTLTPAAWRTFCAAQR